MTNLSPAAQSVINAAVEAGGKYGRATPVLHARIAAALRAAADQVAPVTPEPNDTFCCPPVDSTVWRRVAKIRRQFLAIAAELEGQ